MKRVSSVVIVGGGSAGWMTAALLSRMLLGVRVTLIESPKIPSIGVGEATTPMINNFLSLLGCHSLQQWMPQCSATFKTGILFENWYEKGTEYWHPFEPLDYLDTQHHTGHYWLNRNSNGQGGYADPNGFYDQFFYTTALHVRGNRMPQAPELVAYHFDAALFGKLLRSISPSVTHILDEVTEVELNEQGEIAAVVTAGHGRQKADLFVDCTGFRRQLIGRVAPEQLYKSSAASLFNDRAVVTRIRYDPDGDIEQQMAPYVKASAQSAGWIWTIPLYDKISLGYVHSSQFISEEEAERELERYCGKGWDRSLTNFKVNFTSGRLSSLWVKNCVAIGLAGGFVEPLESSGLAITQVGIELLVSMLDARYYDSQITDRYNLYLDKFYSDIIEFIITHYCLTNREDTPYWKAVKYATHIPESLQARYEVFRKFLPTLGTRGLREGMWAFRDISWFAVMLGMRFQFETPKLGAELLAGGVQVAKNKQAFVDEMLAKQMNHYRYLEAEVFHRPSGQEVNPSSTRRS